MDPGDPLDAQRDADFDGFTTLEEYRLGTSPTAAPSSFRVICSYSPETLVLSWLSRPGNRYQVEQIGLDGLPGAEWERLTRRLH